MVITCLDMEGVLVPEIWIAFAEATGIPELKRTTRDEPDYDKLMNYRLEILKEHHLGLKEIQGVKSSLDQQEQEARIANLRKQADKDSDTVEGIEVVFQAGEEAWNE